MWYNGSILILLPFSSAEWRQFMHKDVERILFTESEIADCVKELGRQITEDYRGKELVAAVIMKGSLMFAADLLRHIDIPLRIDFMQASSYGASTVSSGKLEIKRDLEEDIAGKHLLIIEDIVDSGNTLYNLKKHLKNSAAESVRICSLLSKPERRETEVEVEYIGKVIPDEFVVGYGLDFNQRYRNLPYIGILKREVYE